MIYTQCDIKHVICDMKLVFSDMKSGFSDMNFVLFVKKSYIV